MIVFICLLSIISFILIDLIFILFHFKLVEKWRFIFENKQKKFFQIILIVFWFIVYFPLFITPRMWKKYIAHDTFPKKLSLWLQIEYYVYWKQKEKEFLDKTPEEFLKEFKLFLILENKKHYTFYYKIEDFYFKDNTLTPEGKIKIGTILEVKKEENLVYKKENKVLLFK